MGILLWLVPLTSAQLIRTLLPLCSTPSSAKFPVLGIVQNPGNQRLTRWGAAASQRVKPSSLLGASSLRALLPPPGDAVV